MDYKRGMSPRTRLCGKIFSSTDTRPDFPIPLHTEMAYSPNYPQGVVFSCATPAEEGGETPLIDNLRVGRGRLPYKGKREVFAALVVELWRH